jgi:peptide/nickel transport system substrate-binding protein
MTITLTRRQFALASASIAALSVAAPRTLFAAPKPGGTLVIGSTQVPRHFNGAVQSGVATAMASTQIFASPLRYDDKWNPQPYLAESWEVAADGKSVTLKLVKTAVFHDGAPITSEDVAFSIMTIKANHPFKTMLEPVEAVETPDPHTAVIKLAHPHPALLLAMSPALMPILPKHVYGTGGDIKNHPANLKPVGSGPYRLAEYKQGEYYTLEKFDKFFVPGRPYLDKIVVRLIPDENSLMLSFERGEINMVPYLVGVRQIERAEKMKGVKVTDKGFEGIGPLNWLAFNTKKPPLDDVRVRQAIAYAANRDFIVDKLMAGKATRDLGPIVPGSPFAAKDLQPYKIDLKKANALLDEAGHKKNGDGIRFSLQIDYIPGVDEQQRNIAEYLRPQLKKIGIALEVRAAPDFPTWAQRISNYDFDLTMDSVFNWGDPVIGVARTYLSSNIRKGVIWSNTQQYSNPKVDELLEKAAVEVDKTKRAAMYQEFERIVVNDVPIFFINTLPYHTAYQGGLANPPTTIWGPISPLDEVYWQTPPKT